MQVAQISVGYSLQHFQLQQQQRPKQQRSSSEQQQHGDRSMQPALADDRYGSARFSYWWCMFPSSILPVCASRS